MALDKFLKELLSSHAIAATTSSTSAPSSSVVVSIQIVQDNARVMIPASKTRHSCPESSNRWYEAPPVVGQKCRWTGDSVSLSRRDSDTCMAAPQRRRSTDLDDSFLKMKTSVSDPSVLLMPQRRASRSQRDLTSGLNAGWNMQMLLEEDSFDDFRFDDEEEKPQQPKEQDNHDSDLDSLMKFYQNHIFGLQQSKQQQQQKLQQQQPLRSTPCTVPPKLPVRSRSTRVVGIAQPSKEQQQHILKSSTPTTKSELFTTTPRLGVGINSNSRKKSSPRSLRKALGSLAPVTGGKRRHDTGIIY